jgi:YD repeat-containing protein
MGRRLVTVDTDNPQGIGPGVLEPKVRVEDINLPERLSPETLNATYAAASKPFAVTRDADGKVSGITDNGIAETYTRDASGKVATIVRAGQTITLQRDADGKITGGI